MRLEGMGGEGMGTLGEDYFTTSMILYDKFSFCRYLCLSYQKPSLIQRASLHIAILFFSASLIDR